MVTEGAEALVALNLYIGDPNPRTLGKLRTEVMALGQRLEHVKGHGSACLCPALCRLFGISEGKG